MTTKKSILSLFLTLALLLPLGLTQISPLGKDASTALAAPQLQTTTNTIALRVVSARTEPKAFDGAGVLRGDPVTQYKFIINVDNTGDPADDPLCYAATNPNYPDGCDWPSIRTVPGWSPIYTQGDETGLNGTTTLTLPDGKYLITVMADGYKLDGEHFTLPMESPGVATIEVGLQPLPLPPATMVIKVFEDVSMTNGQYDAPSEDGNPLAGFRLSLNDIAGEITTDLFGNPLCTEYEKDPVTGEVLLDADGAPIILNAGQGCYSDANGIITVPNIGPLRYDVLVFPPAGEEWIQTTTLEGSQGWDTWLQEGGTGLDNEFLIAPEPFPWTIFGFVRPNTPDLGGTGTIQGVIMGAATFVPTTGGLPYVGDTFGGLGGAKLHRPIANPWLSLNDLQNGDTAIWIGQGNADGTFSIPNIPAGNYMLTYWDENQHYILDLVQVTVNDNQVTDLGIRMLTGWFTEISGYVFHDTNSNGKRDQGEPGVPNYLVVLKDRDNTEIDRMSIAALTDGNGFYELEKGYPMGSWMILEAYSDLHHTTGVTYQTLNMPDEETLLGNIVDVGLLPVLGQPVRLDWGVHPYESNENGGIAGTVFYDTVRAEDEARYAGAEPWQPGIPDLTVNLYAAQVDGFGQPVLAADGSYAKGQLLASTTTETFARPKDCVARDADGVPLTGFPVLPTLLGKDCLEGPLMGTQIGDGQNDLDGNWGFGEGCLVPGVPFDPATGLCADGSAPTSLLRGNYLVEVEIPDDASGNPMFIPTREEDLNIFEGDTFIPNVPPPACAGPLHIVDVANAGPDNMAARYHVLQVYSDAAAGTFTLTVNGQETTAPIPYNAPAWWVEMALESLPSLSDITVTGAGTLADPWLIAFETPVVGALTADDTGLGGATITIVEDPSNTITVPASTPTDNPTYAAEYAHGFGRYEGQAMPLCDVKYVQLGNGKAVAPIFNLFTPVPIPGKWKGYLIDNLNVSVDPTTLFYGEMAGIRHVPIGLYDFTGRLVHTIESDYNGVYETLLPSDGTFNAPTPSGMLANVYYLYANDPGPIGQPNLNYNPQYRSIGTSFEIYPGNIMPSDLAPTQNGAAIWSPGILSSLSLCRLNEDPAAPTVPEFFAVDVPYVEGSGTFTIYGLGFGATAGMVQIGNGSLPVVSWSDREIVASVPAGTLPGAYQLNVVTSGGLSTVNGLTFHILGNVQGNRYQPNVYEVGPGRTYDPINYDGTGRGAIQHAIDDAWASGGNRGDLVVVYPGAPAPLVNTLGMYLENPIIYAPVALQGVGPGGGYPDAPAVPGSIIDGRAVGGDSPYNLWWRETFLPDIWDNRGGWDPPILDANGVPIVYEGAVITLLGEDGEFDADENATIDGFILQGGDQQGFPNNINQVGGLPTGAAANVVVQGGGIFANGYVPFLQISNNLIQTNGGSYGGGIRLGTPHIADLLAPDHNDGIRIVHNRILANGGTNLAGAIALFTGATNYEVAYNDICGNSSIEYGGGISHYGLSGGGKIHHNRIYFNSAYDEGGGIMIAGELPADPTVLSPGAGSVRVYNNLIQSNISNDDGGGLRFLMAGNYPYDVYNNMIVNNVSTHEGGGISLNDAPRVNIYNNTIMKNITTATAVTSDGSAAPAGLSSSRNSAVLQATLRRNAPVFSDPRLFNNIFWDNRAGSFDPAVGVAGIGIPGDPAPIYYWDLGVGDGSGLLSPEYCLMQTTMGTNPGIGNLVGQDPTVVGAYDSVVRVLPWRGNPNFVGANIIVLDQPISVTGDYHLAGGSPAIDAGTDRTTTSPVVQAPSTDYDDEPRPSGAAYDIGADEVQLAP